MYLQASLNHENENTTAQNLTALPPHLGRVSYIDKNTHICIYQTICNAKSKTHTQKKINYKQYTYIYAQNLEYKTIKCINKIIFQKKNNNKNTPKYVCIQQQSS